MLTGNSTSRFRRGTSYWRYANLIGYIGLGVWAIWWAFALYQHDLWGCRDTLIHVPLFGADFYSQSDLAARAWSSGIDPYASRGHLFHYPPLVIRLFLWTPLFAPAVALRIWIVVCMAIVVVATLVAVRVREKLDVGQIPASLAVAAVLFSFPVVFELERANFDLITVAALVIAYGLFSRRSATAEFIAGFVLAAGPWVKLYPGLMGLGLVGLRRWRATAGFIVGGVVIFAAAPLETLRSFETLHVAVERVKNVSKITPQAPWGHSLSVAWLKLAQAAGRTMLGKIMRAIPMDVAAGAVVLALAGWVCYRLYKLRGVEDLTYPLLLWLNALGSCVGAIANDYSLAFLPIAVIAVHSFKDPWFVRISMLLLALWWQPVDLMIATVPLLIIKVLGLIAVGVSLVRRASELASAHVMAGASPPLPSEPVTASLASSPQ